MKSVFGDSSYFVALLIPGDKNHGKAIEWARNSQEQIVTTDYVLLEVGNYLSPLKTRHAFIQFVRDIPKGDRFKIVGGSAELLKGAIELYGARMDKEWSLTDCVSFNVMNKEKIRRALAFDHHFSQAGFELVFEL